MASPDGDRAVSVQERIALAALVRAQDHVVVAAEQREAASSPLEDQQWPRRRGPGGSPVDPLIRPAQRDDDEDAPVRPEVDSLDHHVTRRQERRDAVGGGRTRGGRGKHRGDPQHDCTKRAHATSRSIRLSGPARPLSPSRHHPSRCRRPPSPSPWSRSCAPRWRPGHPSRAGRRSRHRAPAGRS